MAQEKIYYAKGMHCAACEILIEKKLLEVLGVSSVDASTASGKIVVLHEGEAPEISALNDIFKNDNYTFFDKIPGVEHLENGGASKSVSPALVGLSLALVTIMVFLLLDRLGISGLLNISSTSSLAAFFGFGLLAGLSSCAALVGGIVLSMSKQWQKLYDGREASLTKFEPHLLFNAGRLISYVAFGGVLGFLGSRLQISLGFTSLLVFAVSALMLVLGLQMLEVPGFRKLQFSLPKFVTRAVANEHNFQGKYMPFVMGAATFFLPCGFTITAQTIALLSGNALQGALIMGFFALGTLPILLIIGLSSATFFSKPHLATIFSKLAGFLVIFFAVFNIINQINVWR